VGLATLLYVFGGGVRPFASRCEVRITRLNVALLAYDVGGKCVGEVIGEAQ
jgi:hypothetical protein